MWPVLVSILAVIIVYLYIYKPLQHWKKFQVPDATNMVLVNMIQFFIRRKTLYTVVENWYNASQGRVVGTNIFNSPQLLIRDLNLIKQLGIKDFDYFVDHKPFISDDIEPLLTKNLFLLRGQKWRDMRTTLSPAFTSSKMKAMFVLISDCAKQFTEYFENIVEPNKPYEVELKETYSRFANDVIATTAFGIQCDSLKNEDNEFFKMGKIFLKFGTFIQTLKFMVIIYCRPLADFLKIKLFDQEVMCFFKNIVKNNIASREKEGIVRPDMIHLLMEARKGKLNHEDKKDEDAGFATVTESNVGKDSRLARQELSDDDITAQAFLFFAAGFDTISTAMCHMSYELAQHPDIQERLQEEIDEALRKCKGKVTYDIVIKLKYLDMVLSETLRKWPPQPVIDRMCNNDYTIEPEFPGEMPIKLRKNDVICFPCSAIHRDPKYYPEPDKFDPERFNDENKGSIDPMTYMPFGVGPRNCIGSRFALMEAKTLFVYLLSKFSIVLTDKSQIPLKIIKGQFNIIAENGFWVGLKKRTSI